MSTSQPARTNISCMTTNSSAHTPLSYLLPSARVHVDAAESTMRILLVAADLRAQSARQGMRLHRRPATTASSSRRVDLAAVLDGRGGLLAQWICQNRILRAVTVSAIPSGAGTRPPP